MRNLARRALPDSGLAYELFDCSVFLTAIVLVGYVIESASPAQERSLTALASVASLTVWGAVVAGAGAFGILCAYTPRWLGVGYGVVITACLLFCGAFILGIAFFDAPATSLPSALVYGWVARRLIAVGLGRR